MESIEYFLNKYEELLQLKCINSRPAADELEKIFNQLTDEQDPSIRHIPDREEVLPVRQEIRT